MNIGDGWSRSRGPVLTRLRSQDLEHLTTLVLNRSKLLLYVILDLSVWCREVHFLPLSTLTGICQAWGAMSCIAVALSNCQYALDLCHRRGFPKHVYIRRTRSFPRNIPVNVGPTDEYRSSSIKQNFGECSIDT